jgi:hypothetical protein
MLVGWDQKFGRADLAKKLSVCILKAVASGPRNASSEFSGRFDPEVDGFIAIHHHFRAIKVRVQPLIRQAEIEWN